MMPKKCFSESGHSPPSSLWCYPSREFVPVALYRVLLIRFYPMTVKCFSSVYEWIHPLIESLCRDLKAAALGRRSTFTLRPAGSDLRPCYQPCCFVFVPFKDKMRPNARQYVAPRRLTHRRSNRVMDRRTNGRIQALIEKLFGD